MREVVERELRTLAGLRSLSRNHPHYRPRYEGDVPSRDSTYSLRHGVAVAAGSFLTAYLRAGDRSSRHPRG